MRFTLAGAPGARHTDGLSEGADRRTTVRRAHRSAFPSRSTTSRSSGRELFGLHRASPHGSRPEVCGEASSARPREIAGSRIATERGAHGLICPDQYCWTVGQAPHGQRRAELRVYVLPLDQVKVVALEARGSDRPSTLTH